MNTEGDLFAYDRITHAIATELANGLWRAGDGLPSEAELAGYFDVSRRTVRKALAALERKGLVAKGQGRRTHYCGRVIARTDGALLDFPTAARQVGFKPSTRLLRAEERQAGLTDARALRLRPGDPVFEVCRLRLLDGKIVVYQRSVLPMNIAARIPVRDLQRQSLYELIRQHACVQDLAIAAEHLLPSQVTGEEARHVSSKAGQDVVRLIRVVGEGSQMVEYSNSILLGPHFSF